MGTMVDIKDIRDKVDKRVKEADTGSGGSGPGDLDSDFIRQCLVNNELGDGELFKRLYRDDFVFNKSMDCWMRWAGHHFV